MITLTGRAEAHGVSGEGLLPESFAAAAESEVARTRLRFGAETAELGDLFHVRTAPGAGEPELRIEPGGVRLHGLGTGMTRGRIVVAGNAGDRLGAAMVGGEILVEGSCGDCTGGEMTGGFIRVHGDAGARAGGALAGGPRGMAGGVILVHGSVGDEAGAAMRRGLVAIGGSAAARAGFHAIAGTVLVLGGVGEAPAMATKRGSLVVFGEARLLPTFRYACEYEPTFLRLLLRYLSGPLAFAVPERFARGRFRRFAGDFSQLGKGEILLWTDA
ncbi:MAG: formylmethanofuran dehydrogenase subunit C [Gemmatimonadetes bacterium]|nr:formylmethanofuran dehydrogenase subunit C [Gemmatimonadota bacterium]